MLVVTGACGFIGSALVSALNQAGHENIILTDFITPTERPLHLANKKYTAFISPEDLLSELSSRKITTLFHMGACSSTTESNWEYLKSVNLDYTKKLFSLAAQLNISLFYASSGSVYGDGSAGFDDQTPTEKFTPLNLYGRSKSEMDIWARQQKQMPKRWAGFRFFNVYGPNEYHKGDMASVAYKAFVQINETKKLKLFKSLNPEFADGKQMRDFVYIKDVTRWLIEFWQNDSFKNGIYNMGYGRASTWLDLAAAGFASLNLPLSIEWIDMPANVRSQYQYFTQANMSELNKQGLSKPKWSIADGVTDYYKNYLLRDKAFI